jgi:hypothetical protein
MRKTVIALLLASACSSATNAQNPAPAPREQRRVGLVRESLAGQPVPLLPLTHVVRDSTLQDPALSQPRTALLAWADSVLAEGLVERAPEIQWVYGAELNRVARKGAGMLPEPSRFGHAVLRSPGLKTVPDPTRSHLRTLTALSGGRYVFVPASLIFTRDEEGAVRATLIAVVSDTRTGAISWRSEAIGAGATAAAALLATIDYFLPEQSVVP